MDKVEVKHVSCLLAQIETHYVKEIEDDTNYKHFELLDDMLNPCYSVIWSDTDTIEIMYDPYDGAMEPLYLNVDGMVGFVILTRLLDKSLEDKPDEIDLLPF